MFENRKDFLRQVFITKEQLNCNLLDAIIAVAEQHNLDIETAASFIKQSHNVKSELLEEARSLRMMKVESV